MNSVPSLLILLVSIILLAGCADKDGPQTRLAPAELTDTDQCHLCGMIIEDFPGPKGELALKTDSQVRKFCSNRDMFAFYLQPENRQRLSVIYVHDMAKSPWAHPDDDYFIDARNAYYVYGSSKQASMGTALASFGSKAAAAEFADAFGGRQISFNDITVELLQQSGMNMDMEDMDAMTE